MIKFFIPLLIFLYIPAFVQSQPDTVPPALMCLGLKPVPLKAPCYNTTIIWATDLVYMVTDDTPGPIHLGIRKQCTGSGFPENKPSVVYTAHEQGMRTVEVWAMDGAGNVSSCQVRLDVYDGGFCDPAEMVDLKTPAMTGIGGVSVSMSGKNCVGDTLWTLSTGQYISSEYGWWSHWGGLLQSGYASEVRPYKKSNPLNGVSTFDLVQIQLHILGIKPLDAPWKIVAADANLDGKVTLQDVVLLQKLILGVIPELPHGLSWRFYPKSHVFTDPADPFATPLPETVHVPGTTDPIIHLFEFTGVKIGDVNGSADPKL